MDHFINLVEFGASADGKTDVSEIFQRAADALIDGGILYLPKGCYRIKKSITVSASHITIQGDGWQTHIIYDYAQKEGDAAAEASAFSFAEGICDVTVRELKLEYEGYFFPHFGESYAGRIDGLHFQQCFDVWIQHCEICGFNSNGINVSTGNEQKYAQRFRVEDCYLHHNRVAGVAFGYVEGISITNCDMEYHGSPLDGGTGYGCAGSSGEKPKYIQIKNNRARFNYRKGIDLHAGVQAVIEGNICAGNRLYGIYAEGPKTGDILIRGNIVSGMQREDVGLPLPYEWVEGISFGVWGDTITNEPYFHYIIAENEITEFGLNRQHARPIHCYSCFGSGSVQIKNNIIHCSRIDSVVEFSQPHSMGGQAISVGISGNQIEAEQTEREIFVLEGVDMARILDNSIRVKQACAQSVVSGGGEHMIMAFNQLQLPGCQSMTGKWNGTTAEYQNYFNGRME